MKHLFYILLFLLSGWSIASAQIQQVTINLLDFEVIGESTFEEGEIEENSLGLFDTITQPTTFQIEMISGFSSVVKLELSVANSGDTFKMLIDSNQIYDENNVLLSQVDVTNADSVFFGVIGNTLFYMHNESILLEKTVNTSGIFHFYVKSLASTDADIFVNVDDFLSSGSGNLMGMIQRTTSPFCVVNLAVIPIEGKYLCGPVEPPMGLSVEVPTNISGGTTTVGINLGAPDVLVSIQHLEETTSSAVFSAADGVFSTQINPGWLQLTPYTDQQTLLYDNFGDTTTLGYDCFLNPPISVEDSRTILDHIDDIKIIDCPFKRIAADIDQNGQIDTIDANIIKDFVLGNIDSLANERWRFVPKAYVIPNTIHPDLNFISSFWNTAKKDNRSQEYPFNASFNFNGTTYSYNGSTSWMDKLHEWPFDSTAACEDTNWGFYLLEIGDVVQTRVAVGFGSGQGNLVSSTNSLASIDAKEFNLSPIGRSSKGGVQSVEKSNQKLSIRVRATSSIPILCYQIGLVLDETLTGIDKINPREDKFKQKLKDNFGQRKKVLDAGVIRTLWIRDVKTEPKGLMLDNDLLFEVELKIKKSEAVNAADIRKLIRLDEASLPSIFYSDGIIDNKVQLTIEVTDKGEVVDRYSLN